MEGFTVTSIGTVASGSSGMYIQIGREYIPALTGLEGFRHLNILWWFHGCDTPENRGMLLEQSPYRAGPASLGVFATRSPRRPTPLALSCVEVTYVDTQAGRIGITWIDADAGSPVLDIKPYTPSLDRVEHPGVPDWCAHWPAGIEASAAFDWESIFNA